MMTCPPQRLKTTGASISQMAIETGLDQRPLQKLPQGFIIVDDQNFAGVSHAVNQPEMKSWPTPWYSSLQKHSSFLTIHKLAQAMDKC